MTAVHSLSTLETLVTETLMRSGTGSAQAASVARALVAAEASGQGGHGLRRVPAYSAQAKAGKVDGYAVPKAETPRPAVLAIDAANGFAFPALDLALERLPAIAREQGIALAAIRRSHHAGVMGLTVERFAEAGLVAIMVANAPAAMAPWGGTAPLFGTNPIAFAAPIADGDPVVVDLSLSKVARGKVMAARQKGVPIPEGWALDPNGQPTTDAETAMRGTMVPLGDAKGAALAMMVEMLAAGLTGANYAYESSSLFDDRGPPPGLGHLVIAIDPVATGGSAARFAEMALRIAEQPGTRVPGRRGLLARRRAQEEGLVIEKDVLDAIHSIWGDIDL